MLDLFEDVSESTMLADFLDLEIPNFLVGEASRIRQSFLNIEKAEFVMALGAFGLSCHLDRAPPKVECQD